MFGALWTEYPMTTTIRSACRAAKAVNVAAGEDRFAAPLVFSNWRFDCKLSAKDTGGDLCIYDTARTGRGGPPMHVHRDQDEWFFVREGRYVFRIGDEIFRLGPGDSLLAPRKIPHAFASLSETSSLLVAFQPAGIGKWHGFEAAIDAILGFQPRGDDVELELADDTYNPGRAVERFENLRGAFFGKLFKSGF